MIKNKIIVPKGIRYINEWKEFELPDHVCIIDKQITGCGFTEFCLCNNQNVILVSPRKILLENKEEQHPGEVLYATTGLEKLVDFEKDLTNTKRGLKKEEDPDINTIKEAVVRLKDSIRQYNLECTFKHISCKILVTYDSFRHVKEALGSFIDNFYVVIDEFQSIFVDAKFKSNTEIEFLKHLNGLQKITFVSATPMIDKYLEMLDEFKDLPYYELDWETEDPSRVLTPKINPHSCSRSINPAANKVIQSYLNGEFESTVINIDGENIEVISKEAVLYVNSVKNICDIISKNGLTFDNTNVLCARTPDNEEKIRKAFGLKKIDLKKLGIESVLGKVPKRGESHKMFTLCTRTVYLGADFYSTNARTFIFSDANIDSLTVDITLDLPQILGRQRLDTNPWKNRADLYYKTIGEDNKITQSEADKIIEEKKKKTEALLRSYERSLDDDKHALGETYQYVAKTANYKDNYVAVNEHSGSDIIPVFNNLVMVSDMRSYEIQQIDYSNRFRVFNNLSNNLDNYITFSQEIHKIEFELTTFQSKMNYIYLLQDKYDSDFMKLILNNLSDSSYSKYYYSISKGRAGTLKYLKGNLEKEYRDQKIKLINTNQVIEEIKSKFIPGEKYTKSYIKETLRTIYESNGYNKTPKANDLEEYFELKSCQVTNKFTGKLDMAFKIVGLRE